MSRKPRYEVRRGFRAPTPGDPSSPDTASWEVWRRHTLFRLEQHVDTFHDKAQAEKLCAFLNKKER